jgi:7-carboxy-7-deazaguanine synthase
LPKPVSTIPLFDPSLVVAEIFGPTFQGEGPSTGRLAMFVRLGRCNLDCQWCDEKQTWDWATFDPAVELTTMPTTEVLKALDAIGAPLLVITGGEPLLQQRDLVPLVTAAHERGWRIEIETNGTITPVDPLVTLVDQWNVSPKLAGSGVDLPRRWRPDALRALASTQRAVAKFVVTNVSELDEVAAIAEAAHLDEIWIMPEGTDAATLNERLACLAPGVLAHRWNLCTRLHILAWGNRRGV